MSVVNESHQLRQAQVKQAFINHLPHQISSIQKRIRMLSAAGWDINSLHLIYSEIREIAETSGAYGLVDASDKLYSLEVYLSSFTANGAIPDPDQTQEIGSLVRQLDPFSHTHEQHDRQPTGRVTEVTLGHQNLEEPEINLNGTPATSNIPNFVVPPAGFVPGDDREPITPAAQPEPVLEEETTISVSFENENLDLDQDLDIQRIAEQSTEIGLGNIADQIVSGEDQYTIAESDDIGELWREEIDRSVQAKLEQSEQEQDQEDANGLAKIYFLTRSNRSSQKLAVALSSQFKVEQFTDVAEFIEVLGAIAPDAVMVDDSDLDQIDRIGAAVKKIRNKRHLTIPLLALSDSRELAHRLRVLRAGADAFIPQSSAPKDVMIRIRELLHSEEDPYRILVIEDDRSQAVFAQAVLRKAGMDVRMESNPMRVIDAMDDFHPDLVLMDLHLPECDGMELTAIIRERDEFINTPIVFLSGESDADRQFDALMVGGDDFLAKPIRPKHLISAVTNRVRRIRAVERRKSQQPKDLLTGLVSRQHLQDQINGLLPSADPETMTAGGVIYFELDQPYEIRKKINLTEFESLTQQIGPLICKALKGRQMAARYGDNAYCALIPDQDKDQLRQLTGQIISMLAEHPFILESNEMRITVSAGICQLSQEHSDAGTIIAFAEQACNEDAGKSVSRIRLYKAKQNADGQRDKAIGEALIHALRTHSLQLLFQPLISFDGTGKPRYQTILKLPFGDDELLPASTFGPLAKRIGVMRIVDKWLTAQSLSIIHKQAQAQQPACLFINHTGDALNHSGFVDWLFKAVVSRKIDPRHLVISLDMPDIQEIEEQAIEYAEKLRGAGIGLCLAQFDGSDQAFELVTKLKPQFVELPKASKTIAPQALGTPLKSLVNKLQEMDQEVIVPGVEDASAAMRLWAANVNFIHGNFVQAAHSELDYQFSEQ